MKIPFLQTLIKQGSWTTQIILVTFSIVLVWVFNQFDLMRFIETQEQEVSVRVSRIEVVLILMLLMLNVSIAYTLLRQFKNSNRMMQLSTSVIIITFLVICVWVSRVFNLHQIFTQSQLTVTGGTNRVELILLMILILISIMATLTLFRKYHRAESIVVMSAYSKKVKYNDDWISIEQFLERELGVQVSHGITPDERDEAIRQFMEDTAREKKIQGKS